MVEITMENGGVMKLELYPDVAPITVENFVTLADEGFYDGLIFHRVISGFMIQGGDPTGTGYGDPSQKKIKGEFADNGVKNDIAHVRGVISMARRGDSMDSATSQFFIMHADASYLDGQYAAFGRVIEGIEVVDEIAGVATDFSDRPLVEQKIKTIRTVKTDA
ncbi:MAG: peptidylprolyl isomerase [Clostridia bacterium]|nr:peptidylprolyl isomerase [Clostridia bacterium]